MLLSRTLIVLLLLSAPALLSCDRNNRSSENGAYETWSEILADPPSEIAKKLRKKPFERCETEGPILRPSMEHRFAHQRNLSACEYRDSLSDEHHRPYQIRYITYAENRPVRVRLLPRRSMSFDAASLQELDIDLAGRAYSFQKVAGENEIEPRRALLVIDGGRWDDYEAEEIIAVALVATPDGSELAFAEIYLADHHQQMREEVWDPIIPFLPDELTLPSTRSSLYADLIGPQLILSPQGAFFRAEDFDSSSPVLPGRENLVSLDDLSTARWAGVVAESMDEYISRHELLGENPNLELQLFADQDISMATVAQALQGFSDPPERVLIVGRYATSLHEEAFRSDLGRRFYNFDFGDRPDSGLVVTLTGEGPSIDDEVLTESELYARSTAHLRASPDAANLHLRVQPANTVGELNRITDVLSYYLENPEGECAEELPELDAKPCEGDGYDRERRLFSSFSVEILDGE